MSEDFAKMRQHGLSWHVRALLQTVFTAECVHLAISPRKTFFQTLQDSHQVVGHTRLVRVPQVTHCWCVCSCVHVPLPFNGFWATQGASVGALVPLWSDRLSACCTNGSLGVPHPEGLYGQVCERKQSGPLVHFKAIEQSVGPPPVQSSHAVSLFGWIDICFGFTAKRQRWHLFRVLLFASSLAGSLICGEPADSTCSPVLVPGVPFWLVSS
jgi:hypothetical protein